MDSDWPTLHFEQPSANFCRAAVDHTSPKAWEAAGRKKPSAVSWPERWRADKRSFCQGLSGVNLALWVFFAQTTGFPFKVPVAGFNGLQFEVSLLLVFKGEPSRSHSQNMSTPRLGDSLPARARA